MLGNAAVVAFVPTAKPEQAKAFYGDVLGLTLTEDGPFALVFQAGRTMLRIQKVESFSPLPFTALGWNVADIAATARKLSQRGIVFERYERLPQDERGIWVSPSGAKVCWFKDPDGNNLSLTQFP